MPTDHLKVARRRARLFGAECWCDHCLWNQRPCRRVRDVTSKGSRSRAKQAWRRQEARDAE